MPIDSSHMVDVPAVSVKLTFSMNDGGSYEGTGFCVDHADRRWLITCRHNVEARREDFLGCNDLTSMALIGESILDLDEERTVVGISFDGFIADCAAIELNRREWTFLPKFDSSIVMWVKGEKLPATIDIRGPSSPESDVLRLTPTGWVFAQGYPGNSSKPVTLRGPRLAALPAYIQPWMITYLPACELGFSGGPVLDLTNERVSLLGITTHRFHAPFSVTMDDGRIAHVGLEASAAVPLGPLLAALERAPPGHSIADAPSP